MSIGFIVFLWRFYDIYNSLFLYPGILCLLRMCGIYVRHHLPSLHPCPMAVFCRQHLRMGPVRLAHRSVRVLLRASRLAAIFTASKRQRIKFQWPSFRSADRWLWSACTQREESVCPLCPCGSCLCTLKPPYGSKT